MTTFKEGVERGIDETSKALKSAASEFKRGASSVLKKPKRVPKVFPKRKPLRKPEAQTELERRLEERRKKAAKKR